MTERSVSDEFWDDPFVEELPKDGKFFYLWCMTNKHLNPSGIFEITIRKIINETGITAEELPPIFDLLSTKVRQYPEKNLIWVKNFTRRQCKSGKFLLGAISYLKTVKELEIKRDYIRYNISLFNEYSIDIISKVYGNGRDTSDLYCTTTNTDLISNTKALSETDDSLLASSSLTPILSLLEENGIEGDALDKREVIALTKRVPFEEMKEAVKRAVLQNKPYWSYVRGILKNAGVV